MSDFKIYSLRIIKTSQFHFAIYLFILRITRAGDWFNIKMSSYQYMNSHCEAKTILRPSNLRNVFPIQVRRHLYIESEPCSYSILGWQQPRYSDITMSAMHFKSHTTSRLFAQPFVQAHIKEKMQTSRHWPLWGESTGDRCIPLTKASVAEKCFH